MSSEFTAVLTNDTFRSQDSNGLWKDYRINSQHFWIGQSTSHRLCPPHIHNYMQLWYVLYDSCQQNFNGKTFDQKNGDFLIVPPYFNHNIDTRDSHNIQFVFCEFSDGFVNNFMDQSKYNLYFDFMYIKPLLASVSSPRPLMSFDKFSSLKIEDILNELLVEYKQSSPFSISYIRMKMVKLLTLLVEEQEKRSTIEDTKLYSKYRTSIKSAQDFIDEHYKENLRLKDVCRMAMMSESPFSCIFKLSTGKSFTEYVNHLRICHARHLLTETDIPLVDIGLECGFYDTAYFNKMFKRLIGVTPGIYRKNV